MESGTVLNYVSGIRINPKNGVEVMNKITIHSLDSCS